MKLTFILALTVMANVSLAANRTGMFNNLDRQIIAAGEECNATLEEAQNSSDASEVMHIYSTYLRAQYPTIVKVRKRAFASEDENFVAQSKELEIVYKTCKEGLEKRIFELTKIGKM